MKYQFSIFLILIGFLAFGQSKTFVGVRAGAQTSSAYIAHSIRAVNMDTDFTTTAHAGLVLKHFNFKGLKRGALNAGLQTGVNYIQRGWRQVFSEENNLPDYSVRLDYLEFPVEAVIYAGKGNTKFFGTAGIYYERLINSAEKNRPNEDELGRDEFNTYIESRDPKNGYGGRASLGVFSTFPFGTIQLEAFTSVSFSGVFEFENRTTDIPDQSNLYSIGISLGYFIGFGKMDF